MIDCHSYNKDTGIKKEKILQYPFKREIPVDNCIANIIKQLWKNGFETEGSWCGHGKENPSIVIPTVENKRIKEYKEFFKKNDTREWKILMWKIRKV